MTNEVKSFYDSLYAVNPSVFGNSSLDFLSRVLNVLAIPSGEALDIGAGEGISSNLLAQCDFKVTAIDISDSAFQSIRPELGIKAHVTSFEHFDLNTEYSLVHIALVLHHVPETTVISLIQSLKNHTVSKGIHVFRLFTDNSDFFKQANGIGFYDNGDNLNDMYKDWSIVLDETIVEEAGAQFAMNEIRQVAFKKQS